MTISIHVQSINKQIHPVTIIEKYQYGKFSTSSSYPDTVKINIYTFMPSGNINTVPIKTNLYAKWLPQYTRPVATLIYQYSPLKYKPIRPVTASLDTPSGNINTVPETINS